MTDIRNPLHFLVLIFVAASGMAQTQQPADLPHPTEAMVVVGSATSVPLAESPRSVTVLPLRDDRLLLSTPPDPLRGDSSVFLEQRGSGGAQDDITIRGGNFEQTLVLLNGFRITIVRRRITTSTCRCRWRRWTRFRSCEVLVRRCMARTL